MAAYPTKGESLLEVDRSGAVKRGMAKDKGFQKNGKVNLQPYESRQETTSGLSKQKRARTEPRTSGEGQSLTRLAARGGGPRDKRLLLIVGAGGIQVNRVGLSIFSRS